MGGSDGGHLMLKAKESRKLMTTAAEEEDGHKVKRVPSTSKKEVRVGE